MQSLVRSLVRFLCIFYDGWFIFLLLRIKSSLYILYTSSLLHISFTNIFSQIVAWLFILLTVSFAEHITFNFNKVQLVNFSFIDYAFGIVSKKSLPNLMQSRFSPMLSQGVL